MQRKQHIVDFRLGRRQARVHADKYGVDRIDVLRVYLSIDLEQTEYLISPVSSLESDENLSNGTVCVLMEKLIHLDVVVNIGGLFIVHFEQNEPYRVSFPVL